MLKLFYKKIPIVKFIYPKKLSSFGINSIELIKYMKNLVN